MSQRGLDLSEQRGNWQSSNNFAKEQTEWQTSLHRKPVIDGIRHAVAITRYTQNDEKFKFQVPWMLAANAFQILVRPV